MTGLSNRARELRKLRTEAETAAWWLLRNRQVLGLKFRRQCPLGPFVADFYCPEAALVVELDGGSHSQPGQMKKDRAKDLYLRSMGLKVLRVANGMVLKDPDAFRKKICEAAGGVQKNGRRPLTRPAPAEKRAGSGPPSPARGEGYSRERRGGPAGDASQNEAECSPLCLGEGRRPEEISPLHLGEGQKPEEICPLGLGEGRRPEEISTLHLGERQKPEEISPLCLGEGRRPEEISPICFGEGQKL